MPPKKRSKIAKSGKSKGASPVAVAGSEGDSDDHGNNTEESQGSQQEVPNLQRHPQGGDNDGELTETQRPSNIKRKKDKDANLTEDQEEKMIDWLRENEIIYNRKRKDYKETDKKELRWKEIAAELDVEGTCGQNFEAEVVWRVSSEWRHFRHWMHRKLLK